MSGRWTEEEINTLQNLYSKTPNQVLAECYLEKRTKSAISTKAKRLDMKKDEGFHYRWKIKNCDHRPPDRSIPKEKLLMGLICGDGSFIIQEDDTGKKFVMKIKLNRRGNVELLENIRDYLGVGLINTYDGENEEIVQYVVRPVPEHVYVLIPIVERTEVPVSSYRMRQYAEWKKELFEYVKNKHGEKSLKLSKKVIKNVE